MTHTLTLQKKTQLTPDTNRYVFDRPAGITFEPGQAADLALNKDGWRDEKRPFTFSSLPDEKVLEFVIKTYPDHDGMTEQLAKIEEGDTVTLSDPRGAITDHGPGVFIAAGAGITPFIPILEKHDSHDKMDCTLLFSNETEADIILRDKWEAMEGLKTVFTVTDDASSALAHGMIDKDFLSKHVGGFDQTFYLCGPQEFVDDVRDALLELGADKDKLVTEEGW